MAEDRETMDRIWGELNMHRLLLLQVIGALALSDSNPETFLAGVKEKSEVWARATTFPGATAASKKAMLAQMLKAHKELFTNLENALGDPRNRAAS